MKTNILLELSVNEAIEITGGGFAYDVGCAIGFLFRSASRPVGGVAYAVAVWEYQHS
jgi:hypothetical protein